MADGPERHRLGNTPATRQPSLEQHVWPGSPLRLPCDRVLVRCAKQEDKLNFVVVIANGDHLKEVMLEPPSADRQGTNRHNRTADSNDKIAPET
jgi:hypothetical protein